MKKTLYTVSVNDYAPQLTRLTFPLMRKYAQKIDAEFLIIDQRKFPAFPCPYEKFQIKELAKKRADEWSIFFDADALIHPDFWDITEIVTKDTTVSNGTDFVPIRFKPDEYFKRDGRFIGKGNWCMIGSDWCRDLWSPLEGLQPDEAAARIFPTVAEGGTVVDPHHLIDDFTVSRNIARYGLKHRLIPQLLVENCEKIKAGAPLHHLFHIYTNTLPQKEFYLKRQLMLWACECLADDERNQSIQQMISQLSFLKNGDLDWQDFLAVTPCGERILKTIQSWGIEINKKEIDEISLKIKIEVLLAGIAPVTNCQEKMNDIQAIQNMQENVLMLDFINTLNFKDVVFMYLKGIDVDLNKGGKNAPTC